MDKSTDNSKSGLGINVNDLDVKLGKGKTKRKKDKSESSQASSTSDSREVLLKLPGGFKYKLPGKQQRVGLASVVLGLNVVLLVAVILYFYSPTFHDFIFTVGRK